MFISASVHLGCQIRGRAGPINNRDFQATDRVVEACTSLGLLGTVIGLILTTGAFKGIDVANYESIKHALVAIASGIGTALITTMVGLICALCLQIQLAVTREKWRT
jgi:biopolymer transport protein ExbB/TolQ